MTQFVIYLASFALLAIASKQVGRFFSKIGLPYITGYLLIGMVGGPFILGWLPQGATTELRFIDEISLGIIAFVAGSELYIREIRTRIQSIGKILISVGAVALPVSGIALYFLTEFIPFTQGMSQTERVAVAILGTTILLALSPPSTIAVIKEVRAKGDYTRTLLGVTVTMDVIIVVLFAVAVAISSALLTSVQFSASFLLLLAIDLGLAVVAGYLVGKTLEGIMSTPFHLYAKTVLVIILGYGVFWASHIITELTYGSAFEIHIESLLVAMIGGFYVTNFTDLRTPFEGLLHDVGPLVYVAFFTLTGVGIKLDILAETWPIAVALFAIRFIGINIGGFVGSRWAGEPSNFTKFMGLGLITQAGIALGLSREVAIAFPSLGDAFATMVISVIVLNEVFGPMFLKSALRRVGEAADSNVSSTDETREVIIAGIEPQSVELARQMRKVGWGVIMIDTDHEHVNSFKEEEGIVAYFVPVINETELEGILTPNIDAVVAMLLHHESNMMLCELAARQNVSRLVARPNDLSQTDALSEFGALVVDPTSAMVNLLEQTVRAPQSAAVLLHQDSGRELVQVTVSNPDIDGMLVRDLRLPNDVLFMDVTRDGNVILPNGYTRLRLKDDVTLIGRGTELEEAVLKLGF